MSDNRVLSRYAATRMADGYADALQGIANRREMHNPDDRFQYDIGHRDGDARLKEQRK